MLENWSGSRNYFNTPTLAKSAPTPNVTQEPCKKAYATGILISYSNPTIYNIHISAQYLHTLTPHYTTYHLAHNTYIRKPHNIWYTHECTIPTYSKTHNTRNTHELTKRSYITSQKLYTQTSHYTLCTSTS